MSQSDDHFGALVREYQELSVFAVSQGLRKSTSGPGRDVVFVSGSTSPKIPILTPSNSRITNGSAPPNGLPVFVSITLAAIQAKRDSFIRSQQNVWTKIEFVISESGVVESGCIPGFDHLCAFVSYRLNRRRDGVAGEKKEACEATPSELFLERQNARQPPRVPRSTGAN